MSVTALLFAFGAGLASFVSPCVLPLVPVYFAQLVGPGILGSMARPAASAASATTSATASAAATGDIALKTGVSAGIKVDEKADEKADELRRDHWRAAPLLHAAAFVAGFGVTFIALGATASALGALLAGHQQALRQIGGVALVVFGLHIAGILRLPWLERERRFSFRAGAPGYLASLGLGLVFGIGWTPCVGPYLASILVLAASAHTLGTGVALLAVYALGLGLPFLLVGAAFDRLAPALKRLSPHLPLIERIAGLLLVALGVVIFFNWLIFVNSWLKIGV